MGEKIPQEFSDRIEALANRLLPLMEQYQKLGAWLIDNTGSGHTTSLGEAALVFGQISECAARIQSIFAELDSLGVNPWASPAHVSPATIQQ